MNNRRSALTNITTTINFQNVIVAHYLSEKKTPDKPLVKLKTTPIKNMKRKEKQYMSYFTILRGLTITHSALSFNVTL